MLDDDYPPSVSLRKSNSSALQVSSLSATSRDLIATTRSAPSSLSRLPDLDRPTIRIGCVHEPQVDCADGVVVVVQDADRLEVGLEVGLDLLRPLTFQGRRSTSTSCGIDVAADADRVAVVKTLVATGLRTAHQEDALPVAQHDVRDDLLPGRIRLRLGARPELAVLRRSAARIRRRTGLDDTAPIKPAGHVSARGRPNTCSDTRISHLQVLECYVSNIEARLAECRICTVIARTDRWHLPDHHQDPSIAG